MAHDLIFFEKRSTPKVVSKGQKFTAPESYGKQTRRRPATADEEKKIAKGDGTWIQVDQSGNKPGDDGYKKTRMKGRQHLVKHSELGASNVGAILSHYGKKGMKWGVRNEDRPAGKSSSTSEQDSDGSLQAYKDAANSLPQRKGLEASKELLKNKQKFIDKADDPGPELPNARQVKRDEKAKGFSDKAAETQKRIDDLNADLSKITDGGVKAHFRRQSIKNELNELTVSRDKDLREADRAEAGKLSSNQRKALLAVGVGAVVAGSIAYSIHAENKKVADLQARSDAGDKKATLDLYNYHRERAVSKTWMFGNFITDPESWNREEFELPAGHTFNRISTRDESSHGFRGATYSTPSEADFNRYVAGFRQEKGPSATFHHVTFTTKTPTKVPNLKNVLDTMVEVKQSQGQSSYGPKAAILEYQKLSGGSWDSPAAKSLFTALKAKGYGAMVDEMDSGVIGDKPLVFFDPDNANPKQSRPLGLAEITRREQSIQLMDRPPRKA